MKKFRLTFNTKDKEEDFNTISNLESTIEKYYSGVVHFEEIKPTDYIIDFMDLFGDLTHLRTHLSHNKNIMSYDIKKLY